MARIKRGSAVLETARQRLAGLKSINPKPNFGPNLDIDKYEEEINALAGSLERYNDTLTLLDRLQNEIEDKDASLNDKNGRMLAATGANYGTDSDEYEAVGGTRKRDRKRSSKKKSGGS